MTRREKNILQLIARYRGITDSEQYASYQFNDPQPVMSAAREILDTAPPEFGQCAMLSASWAGYLHDHTDIPAIVVAGDLKIQGKRVFRCKKNLPQPTKKGRVITDTWDGHCWIEIDGVIGDLSIFRTAYMVPEPSLLKDFVTTRFGVGRGAFICRVDDLPDGMVYVPKYVLNDKQIDSQIAGVGYKIENMY